MADSVIVLDPRAKSAKTHNMSRLTELDILPSFPESLEDKMRVDNAVEIPQKCTSRRATNAVNGASQEDLEDLARRTGDISLYLYYYRAIGLQRTLHACLILAVFTLASNFPRFWLQWYTDDPIPRFMVFIGVYVMLVLIASLSQGAMIWLVIRVDLQVLFIGPGADVDRQIMISIVPKSGAELHKILLRTIMHAPMNFFSTVDSGVTLNRFSQDMTLVDAVLPTAAFGTYLGRCCHGRLTRNPTNSFASCTPMRCPTHIRRPGI